MKLRGTARVWPYLLALSLLLVAACASSPTPTTYLSPLPTPVGTGAAASVQLEGPLFSLHEPLDSGQTLVTGQGPKGMTIAIADITYMGEVLGRGRIDQDGRFRIEVAPPLIANHRIGIMLDPEATDITYTAGLFADLERFRGDNAITIPNVGVAYDAASVRP